MRSLCFYLQDGLTRWECLTAEARKSERVFIWFLAHATVKDDRFMASYLFLSTASLLFQPRPLSYTPRCFLFVSWIIFSPFSFHLFIFLLVFSSRAPFCSNPPGLPGSPLGVSRSLCFSLSLSLPVSIPPSHYLFFPLSPRPSVCLAYFLWRIVLVSSSLNKTRLFSPWGKTVLSSPQTCRPSPCLLPPPPTPHPNCLASAPSGKLPYSPHFSTVSSFPPFSSSHPEYQHLDRASFMLVTFLPTPLVSSLHLTVICQ